VLRRAKGGRLPDSRAWIAERFESEVVARLFGVVMRAPRGDAAMLMHRATTEYLEDESLSHEEKVACLTKLGESSLNAAADVIVAYIVEEADRAERGEGYEPCYLIGFLGRHGMLYRQPGPLYAGDVIEIDGLSYTVKLAEQPEGDHGLGSAFAK
jgi:hypothetical protein